MISLQKKRDQIEGKKRGGGGGWREEEGGGVNIGEYLEKLEGWGGRNLEISIAKREEVEAVFCVHFSSPSSSSSSSYGFSSSSPLRFPSTPLASSPLAPSPSLVSSFPSSFPSPSLVPSTSFPGAQRQSWRLGGIARFYSENKLSRLFIDPPSFFLKILNRYLDQSQNISEILNNRPGFTSNGVSLFFSIKKQLFVCPIKNQVFTKIIHKALETYYEPNLNNSFRALEWKVFVFVPMLQQLSWEIMNRLILLLASVDILSLTIHTQYYK